MSAEILPDEVPYNVIFLWGEHNPRKISVNKPLPQFLSGITKELWDSAKTDWEVFNALKALENFLQLDIGLSQIHRHSNI